MATEIANYQTVVAGRWNRHSSGYPLTQELWRARNQHDWGKVPVTDLRLAQDQVTGLLLELLETVGVDFVGDGGFRWDSIYDVTRGIKGCSGFEQLTRIPGTNQFHRQPVVELPLVHMEPLLVADLSSARRYTPKKPIVVSLPGPYSTARQTQNVGEIGLAALAFAYADVFNQEAVDLIRNGAALVRIEEPQILDHPEDQAVFNEAMARLTEGVDLTRLALATWFGPVRDPDFFKLPFGIFALDFVNGRGSVEALEGFSLDKKLVAGIVDAQHPYRETNEELSALLEAITEHIPPSRVLLGTSTDLHFLPWDEAVSKVHRLVEFATIYRSGARPADNSDRAPIRIISPATTSDEIPGKLDFSRRPRIVFPTSTVGSFPQPRELRDARGELRKGMMSEGEYLDLVRIHTRRWMDTQDWLGITVPVSGEFARDDMAAYFGRKWGGKEGDYVPSYENRRYRPIVYHDQLLYGQPLTVEDFLFLQSISNRPVKPTLTGPATMADWALIGNGDYYRDQNGFRRELAQAVRAEVRALIDAGATIIQVDEPALTTKTKRLPGDLQAIYDSIVGFQDSAYLVLHLCYSDMGALDRALPDILQLPFHQIHMEMANRGYGLLELIKKHGFGDKDIGLGVVDVHNDRIETVEEIMAGVRRAREMFLPRQIWLTPDCGLKERSEAVALAKLGVMCHAAERCRLELV